MRGLDNTIMIFSQFFGSIALVCTKYIPEMSFARFACLLSPFNLESEQEKNSLILYQYGLPYNFFFKSNQHKMYQKWSLSGQLIGLGIYHNRIILKIEKLFNHDASPIFFSQQNSTFNSSHIGGSRLWLIDDRRSKKTYKAQTQNHSSELKGLCMMK